jgi:hypothetical protein
MGTGAAGDLFPSSKSVVPLMQVPMREDYFTLNG